MLVLEIWAPVHPISNVDFMRPAGLSLSLFFMKLLFTPGHLETILSVSPSLDWGFPCPFFSQRKHFSGGLGFVGFSMASLMAQGLKNPLVMQETEETRVQSLGREDSLGEEMATPSSFLAWKKAMAG